MCSFKSIYFVIFILNLCKTHAEISDKRLCADPECKEPLSLAKTLLRYSSPDPRLLSFAPNTDVTIYSKEAGSETNLWGVVINGRRGYVPKHLVREYKVFKKPTLLVDTKLKQKPQVPKEEENSNIQPDGVKKSYEVVDGTTIYLNPQESVSPSTTESPVLSTALPSDNASQRQQTVEDSKEKDATKTDSTKDSVVDNFLSFSNWMNDTESKELDSEEDDDDEGDEDEEDEEEDSLEEDLGQSTNNSHEVTKNVDQNTGSSKILTPEVEISHYSLETDQSPTKGDTNKDGDLKDKPPIQELKVTPTEKIATPVNTEHAPVPPIAETLDTSKAEESKPAENLEKSEKSQSGNTEDVALSNEEVEATPPKPEEKLNNSEESQSDKTDDVVLTNQKAETTPTKPEGKEENKTEEVQTSKVAVSKVDDIPTTSESKETEPIKPENTKQLSENITQEKIEPVTQPSIVVEEEQIPILDVTTPDPLQLIKDLPKTGEVRYTEPPEDIEKNEKGINISVTDTDKFVSQENEEIVGPQENVPAPQNTPSENLAVTQNPINNKKSGGFLPPLNFFSPSQNQVIDDKTQAENNPEESYEELEENKLVDDSQASAPTEKIEEPEENLAVQNEDAFTPEVVNTVEDQSEDSSVSKEVPDLQKTENVEEEIYIDESNQEQNQDTSNTEEDLQQAGTENVIEVPAVDSPTEDTGGTWSGLLSLFGGSSDESSPSPVVENPAENVWTSQDHDNTIAADGYCDAASESCNTSQQEASRDDIGLLDNIGLKFNTDFFILLVTTAGSVIIFLFIYMALDRHKREAPLIARINKLEKELLITLKENELLQEKGASEIQVESVSNEVVEQLTQRLAQAQLNQQALELKVLDLEREVEAKAALEEQIENLEKELETSTEVGMELNRIISEMLDPTNGSDTLKENVEQFQRQLLEQKDIINNISANLRDKEAENRTLHEELERSKRMAADLQNKLDEMVEKILKIEREKDQQQNSLQNEITIYQQKYNEAISREEVLSNDLQITRMQLSEVQRQVEIKSKEYQTLRESINKIKSLKNDDEALKSLLDATSIRAEIQQLRAENAAYAAQLQQEQALKVGFEKKYQTLAEEIALLKEKYEIADKEKVEATSKLEVLNNYFKKRESELQEEIIKYKSIWEAKEGEATSTTERIKYMQEEIENYKGQNETLKQEIISQEIELKSQISMLEKKVHENWVTARQTERKLEDARQEAAQLRNRLTLRERAINEERIQNRLQSPVEQNGELPLSPHPIESPASPPLLYGVRDHITKSPPLPGLPPFLPPPPGAPFMPPHLRGMPPFMPPPLPMFPGDHRPPPLGRMSSPPLNSRYSPDTSAFSPYDRNSPSPTYDSEYGASPPPIRGYSPYNSRDDRRDYKRPPHVRSNGRNGKGSVMSSGSDHSNDSIDKVNRKQSKMV